MLYIHSEGCRAEATGNCLLAMRKVIVNMGMLLQEGLALGRLPDLRDGQDPMVLDQSVPQEQIGQDGLDPILGKSVTGHLLPSLRRQERQEVLQLLFMYAVHTVYIVDHGTAPYA